MKKILSFLLIIAILLACIGCRKDDPDNAGKSSRKVESKAKEKDEPENGSKAKEKNELENGQMYFNFKKDTVALSISLSGEDAEDTFDIDMNDSNNDIKDAIADSFGNDFDEVEITAFKKGKDYIYFTIEVDADSFSNGMEGSYYAELSLGDLADEYGLGSVGELCDYYTFVDYSKEKDIDEEDLEVYGDDYVAYVFAPIDGAFDNGVYFQFPNKILLITDNVKYKKISSNTIFIKGGSDAGLAVIKK